jgi:hypothetical protein
MPHTTDPRHLAFRISVALLVLGALFPLVLLFIPRAADTPGEPSSISLANNVAFELMLLGFALNLRNPRLELPFLVAKASLSFLMAMATAWQTFEAPLVRVAGSVAIFLAFWRILPKEPDFLNQLED